MVSLSTHRTSNVNKRDSRAIRASSRWNSRAVRWIVPPQISHELLMMRDIAIWMCVSVSAIAIVNQVFDYLIPRRKEDKKLCVFGKLCCLYVYTQPFAADPPFPSLKSCKMYDIVYLCDIYHCVFYTPCRNNIWKINKFTTQIIYAPRWKLKSLLLIILHSKILSSQFLIKISFFWFSPYYFAVLDI